MATLEEMLNQFGSTMADIRGKSQDLDNLARSGGDVDQLLRTANYVASSRLRLADNIEEMITATKMPAQQLQTFMNNQNSKLFKVVETIASTNNTIQQLVDIANQTAGADAATETAAAEVRRTIRSEGDRLLELNQAQQTAYIASLTAMRNRIGVDAVFTQELVNNENVKRTAQRAELNAAAAAARAKLAALQNDPRIRSLQDKLGAAGSTVVVTEFLSNDQARINTTLDTLATERETIRQRLDEESQILLNSITSQSELTREATQQSANIRFAPADVQADIVRKTEQQIADLNQSLTASRRTKAETDKGNLQQRLEKTFSQSNAETLKSVGSLNLFSRELDSGSQKVSNMTLSLTDMIVKLVEGKRSFGSFFGVIGEQFKDPAAALKSLSDSAMSLMFPLGKVLELSTKTAAINTSTGGLAKSIRDITFSSGGATGGNAALKELNATMYDQMDALQGLTNAVPGFLSQFNPSAINRLSTTAVELKRLGVEVSSFGEILNNLRGYVDLNRIVITDQIKELERFSISLELGAGKATDALKKLTKEFAGFYTDFTQITKTILAAQAASGASLDTIVSLTKKFGNVEESIKMIASLNYALGNFNLNIIELQRLKPEDRLLRFVEALQQTGQKFSDLNPQIQQFVASQSGISDVTEAAKILNMSMFELQTARALGEKDAAAKEKALKLSIDLQTRLKNLLVTSAPFLNKLLNLAEKIMSALEGIGGTALIFGGIILKSLSFIFNLSVAYRNTTQLNQALLGTGSALNAANRSALFLYGTIGAVVGILGILATYALVSSSSPESDTEGLRYDETGMKVDSPVEFGGSFNDAFSSRDTLSRRTSSGINTIGIAPTDSLLAVDFTKPTPFSTMVSSVLGMFGINTGMSQSTTNNATNGFFQTMMSSVFGDEMKSNTSSTSLASSFISSMFDLGSSPETILSKENQMIASDTSVLTKEALSKSSNLASNYYDKQSATFEKQSVMLQKIEQSNNILVEKITESTEKTTALENLNLTAKFDFTGFANEFEKKVIAKVDQRFRNSPFPLT